jgi:hypothetical protein
LNIKVNFITLEKILIALSMNYYPLMLTKITYLVLFLGIMIITFIVITQCMATFTN